MNLRHLLSWKSLFYGTLLPIVRALGPARGDALLERCGRVSRLWRARRREVARGLALARETVGAQCDDAVTGPRLAANAWRFLARDCALQGVSDSECRARFDVRGIELLEAALAEGRGALLVGSHFGAHLAGVHWLHRRGLPLRLLVQRPNHISAELDRRFDEDGPHPQAGFFLRRDLPPGQCVERLLRARAALRTGMAVYLNGDIPWSGPNTRPGRFLGQDRRFLSVWADLSVLTGAPVFTVLCSHLPRGRYGLTIEPLWVGETSALPQHRGDIGGDSVRAPNDWVVRSRGEFQTPLPPGEVGRRPGEGRTEPDPGHRPSPGRCAATLSRGERVAKCPRIPVRNATVARSSSASAALPTSPTRGEVYNAVRCGMDLQVQPLVVPRPLAPGTENAAVARYLNRLEAAVAARPDDAPAHLLWPCYGPPTSAIMNAKHRPSRRIAAGPVATVRGSSSPLSAFNGTT